jgi:hypothetical protein
LTWLEGNFLEGSPVLAQRNFGFCATIDVAEDDSRQATVSQLAQIVNVHNSWRSHCP